MSHIFRTNPPDGSLDQFQIGDLVVWAWAIPSINAQATVEPACHTLLQVVDKSKKRMTYDYVTQSLDTGNRFYDLDGELADASVVPGLVELYGRMSNQERRRQEIVGERGDK